MSENEHKDHLNGIIKQDAEEKREKQKNRQEITFRQYLGLLQKDPLIAQNSPSRLWEVIRDAGVIQIPEEERWLNTDVGYELFRKELYGSDKPISMLVDHIKIGATKGSTGKQILVLVGPPASGKSTAVRTLVKALEAYKKRPVFAIKGCPKHEEPLHLLPRKMKDMVALKIEDCPECSQTPDNPKHLHLGIKIEGDLCPVCRHLLTTKYKDNDGPERWYDVPVETFTFSVQARRGIGSFEPSDQKTSDITILTGRENIAITADPNRGHTDPRAYELRGEIPTGERGLVEGREILSSDPAVLRVFFSVAEEKELKVEGAYFPHISTDTTIIGHTNINVFKKFNSNRDYEGLHDRFLVVPWPYPLKIKEEIKIYRKLIERESDFIRIRKCHIAPGTLEMTALFAILTRLKPSEMGIDVLTKAKIYNGDRALTEIVDKEKKPIDKRELEEEGQSDDDISKKEGMYGVSSRTVLAALNSALSKEAGNNGCLTPAKALLALRNGFEQRMGFSPEDIARYKELLSSGEKGSVLVEYKDFVNRSVTKAYLRAYEDLARELFGQYIQEIAFARGLKRRFVTGSLNIERDKLSGKPKEPNFKFIRSVEEFVPISESEAEIFRGEILEFMAGNPKFNYDTYSPLARAVERNLLSDSKSTLKLVLATDKPKTEEDKKRANDLFSELTREDGLGFCKTCAIEILGKAAEFLNE